MDYMNNGFNMSKTKSIKYSYMQYPNTETWLEIDIKIKAGGPGNSHPDLCSNAILALKALEKIFNNID